MIDRGGAPPIILDAEAEENGLALLLADLIRANLERRPERRRLFAALRGTVHVVAADADVAASLVFGRDRLVVKDGRVGRPALVISADSDALLELTTLRVRFGLPNCADATGRAVLAKLLRGQVRVRGLVTHPIMLTRFTILLSVH